MTDKKKDAVARYTSELIDAATGLVFAMQLTPEVMRANPLLDEVDAFLATWSSYKGDELATSSFALLRRMLTDHQELVSLIEIERKAQGWLPIRSAPKDKPILGWCMHEADPYHIDAERRLTTYGGFCEGGEHVCDGPHVLVWGGAFDDRNYEEPDAAWMPDWWFLRGSDFEIAANPVLWKPIDEPQGLPTYLGDGWVAWDGKQPLPLRVDQVIDVRYRHGVVERGQVSAFRWRFFGLSPDCDIVAYREANDD